MKRCPSCNRTYADETLSFCLADGDLLSAPYDPSRDEAPPTEVLPATRPAVPPTEPHKAAIPTIPSFPVHQRFEREPGAPEPRKHAWVLWLVSGLALAMIVAGLVVVAFLSYGRGGAESPGISNQEGLLTEVNAPSPSPIPSSSATSPTSTPTPATRSTPQPVTQAATPQASPLSSPSVISQPLYAPAGPTARSADNYSGIFSNRDVDSKATIIERPKPVYTEEARKNQIQGTVRLRVVLSAGGEVTNIQVLSGLPSGLSESAIAAAKRIRFTPAMKDGRPVSTYLQVEYNFSVY